MKSLFAWQNFCVHCWPVQADDDTGALSTTTFIAVVATVGGVVVIIAVVMACAFIWCVHESYVCRWHLECWSHLWRCTMHVPLGGLEHMLYTMEARFNILYQKLTCYQTCTIKHKHGPHNTYMCTCSCVCMWLAHACKCTHPHVHFHAWSQPVGLFTVIIEPTCNMPPVLL